MNKRGKPKGSMEEKEQGGWEAVEMGMGKTERLTETEDMLAG